MSNLNPIIPPSSPLHPKPSNSKFLVSVALIVAVHAVILSGLLIQGCQRQGDTRATDELPKIEEPSSGQPPPARAPSQETARVTPPSPGPGAAPASTPPMPAPPQMTPSEPSVAAARPNVPPTPVVAAEPPEPSHARTAAPGVKGNGSSTSSVYVVKTGDSLTKIARAHGTTLRALRTANNLKTDRILVGQKLKIPAGDAGEGVAAP
jgi:LysM repeat protein